MLQGYVRMFNAQCYASAVLSLGGGSEASGWVGYRVSWIGLVTGCIRLGGRRVSRITATRWYYRKHLSGATSL